MRTKNQFTKTSIIRTIDFVMAQTGINREQAIIAFRTLIYFMKTNPAEPFYKLMAYLSRSARNRDNCSMN